jgi:hypothetical protein
MRNLRLNQILLGAALFVASLALTGFPPAGAQTDREQPPHTRPPVSQAEQEAEKKVSLSAGKIIEILRSEPGLLLAVKKMLVRNAYEQGRILESADLSDEALFRLLREDDNVRVLATREIEDRYYVRAKPTQRELEQQPILDEQRALVSTAAPKPPQAEAPTATDKPRLSQEDRYWDQHESSRKNYQPQDLPDQLQESYPSTPNPPENSVPHNPAREVRRASLQQEDDITGNLGQDQRYKANARGTMRPQMQTPPLEIEPPVRQSEPLEQATLGLPKRAILAPSELDLDRPQIRHRPNPYANIPSLYDLYAQVSRRPTALERFGMEVFRNGTGNIDALPMDLPAGPDYVLGPGDGLNIELWGGVTQRLQRVVDREGRVALPEIGGVQVSDTACKRRSDFCKRRCARNSVKSKPTFLWRAFAACAFMSWAMSRVPALTMSVRSLLRSTRSVRRVDRRRGVRCAIFGTTVASSSLKKLTLTIYCCTAFTASWRGWNLATRFSFPQSGPRSRCKAWFAAPRFMNWEAKEISAKCWSSLAVCSLPGRCAM